LDLEITDDALAEVARIATLANARSQNIGARRLHTVMEKLLEELSFTAPERHGTREHIDAEYVRRTLHGLLESEDMARYIL
jgi:ATP-dependent HslUV protease ATP-binding subunit HslU